MQIKKNLKNLSPLYLYKHGVNNSFLWDVQHMVMWKRQHKAGDARSKH